MKTLITTFTALTLLFAIAAPAQADVGFESSSRKAAAPGDRVDLTIGCGFCFPPCVGEPGHRHPPGDLHGPCMLGDRGGPPASFSVWMTPQKDSLDRYTCDPGEYRGPCQSGSRPPRLPSFIYLGRAVPARYSTDDKGLPRYRLIPRYRLTFDVPESRPGRYKYVLFCDSCVDGPRGSLIDDRANAAGPCGCCRRLRRRAAVVGVGHCPGSAAGLSPRRSWPSAPASSCAAAVGRAFAPDRRGRSDGAASWSSSGGGG